jgi:colanic acid/amylovoran biosynthesis glycosyltransferase
MSISGLQIDMTASVTEQAPTSRNIEGRRLAYLLSSYPAVSHTFLLNEISELRKLGFTIDVASINIPDAPSDGVTAREMEELEGTFYIKAANRLEILMLLVRVLFTRPLVMFRGLRAVLELGAWNLYTNAYALFYLVEALVLGDWLLRRGHNHLHVHFGGSVATVGMLTSIAWEIPYSMMIHGPDEFYDVNQSHLRRKVERAQFVLCISDYCRSQVMKICAPAHWDKLHVLRLGVDPNVFAPDHSAGDASVVEIVCVGRLVATKGQLVLLRAIAELLERGYPLRLRLVGDGADRHTLQAFIREHQLESSIILEGARNHEATQRLLGQADIFVLASFAEGLPVALMEAMAMEIACVSTYVGAIPELIRDGLDGLLVPPSSHEGLVTAIERLMVDLELRRSLATSGRARVLEFYNLERNMRELAVTLESCLPPFISQA